MRIRTALPALLFVLFSRAAYAKDNVTFNKEVVRILQQHCQTCHRPGNIAPFSLMTYSEARQHAFEIRSSVMSGEMPPWKPMNAHGVFQGERSLSDQEIDTLSQWAMAGAPEGVQGDLPEPLSFPQTWQSGEPNIVAQPTEPYAIPSGSDDIYRCFPLSIN